MLAALLLPTALLGTQAPPLPLLLWGSAGLSVLVGWAVWRTPEVWVRRAMEETPEAFPVDTVVLECDARGLERIAPSFELSLSWDAVEGLVVDGEHVFLHLSDVQAIAVPRRVLGTPGEEAAVLDRLRTWMGAGGPVLPEAVPDPGRDAWVLRYRLHVEDWALASRKVQARRLRSRPVLIGLGLLLPVLLITSLEPWHGDADPMLVGLMIAFGALFVALGAFRWWLPAVVPWMVRRGLRQHPHRMPVGEVCLGAGGEGGWLQTSRGISRFRWAALVDVVNDADGVLLLFSEERGLLLPERTFETHADQDRFVEEVQRWRRMPSPRGPTIVERRDREGMPGVFEPPES
jgi:hypothetical protein